MNLGPMIERLPADRRLAIVLRHAEREPIDRVEDSVSAPLTDAGRQAARELGSRLAGLSPLRCFHSPVPRCAETAELLAAGARSCGARAEVAGVQPDLGGPYMHDWQAVMARVLEQGAIRLTEEWFAGRLPAGLADDAYRAARQQLMVLVDQLHDESFRGCNLNLTHDWNLLLVRHHFLGLGIQQAGWPGYLEAVAACLDRGRLELSWGDLVRQLPLPLPDSR